jgi:hypothetical protein
MLESRSSIGGQPKIGDFDAAARLVVLGVEVLSAIVATIIESGHISKADLEDWPSEYNLVAHAGGMFLVHFVTPGSARGAPAKTAAQVKACGIKFEEERTSFEEADTEVKAGLEKVVTVLTAKSLVPSDPGKQAALDLALISHKVQPWTIPSLLKGIR